MKSITATCLLSIFLSWPVSGQSRKSCVEDALSELKQKYPRGYEIYFRLQPDRQGSLKSFIDCSDYNNRIMSLETVVRESVHFLDALLTDETGKPTFYLIDNTTLSISLSEEAMLAVNSAKLNAIYNLLSEEEKDNGGYSEEYLTGNYGNQDFFSLLDELNAYANGLNSSIKLPRPKNGNSHSALAGPLAMIVFVLRYYQYHEQVGPTYFKNVLMNGSLRTVVHILINQALDEVKAGRQLPDLQVDVEFWEKTLQVKEQLRMLKLIIP